MSIAQSPNNSDNQSLFAISHSEVELKVTPVIYNLLYLYVEENISAISSYLHSSQKGILAIQDLLMRLVH